MEITAELARKHFSYEPETGVLRWKEPRARRVKVGDVAGTVTHQGYREVRLKESCIGAHRLVWLMVHGSLPERIDHINGDPLDNRIGNLRAATNQENVQNQRRARSDNQRSSLIGAAFHKASGKFRARIGLPDGTQKHLGLFATAQAAHEAYVAAKRQHHSFCTI